jgi:multidrug efflux pump subunit AcrA (membrane-fusion protein)
MHFVNNGKQVKCKMKKLKLVIPILIVAAVLILASSCSSKSSSTTTKTLTATVTKGNISLEVTGTGNLAFSDTEDLAFEMAGTVEEVSVAAGDTVSKGQELARLDTSTWEDEIEALQKALVTAQRTLASDQRQVNSKELALRSAQLDVTAAENNLTSISEVEYAQDQVDNLEDALDTAQANYDNDPVFWSARIESLNIQLVQAKSYLSEVLKGTSATVSSDVALQIDKYVLAVDQAKLSLESAQAALDDAKTNLSDDEEAVNTAQTNLDEAKALSPIITAPFSGFVTKVNVSGGDEILKGTVAVQIADPDKFKATLQVTEDDISSISLGGSATVSVDSLDTTYSANITAIAPLATVSSGVVSYTVTVELDTSKTISSSASAFSGMTPPSGFSANTTMPSGMTPPTNISRPTDMPTGSFPSINNGSNTSGTSSGTSTTTTKSVTLKSGLTATVTITVIQSENVLLIPTKALTRSGQTYTVQVVNGSTTETRTVVTGNSDDSNTEIKSGVSEGETVQYTTTNSSSSSSKTSTSQQGIGGIGGFSGGGGPPGGF